MTDGYDTLGWMGANVRGWMGASGIVDAVGATSGTMMNDNGTEPLPFLKIWLLFYSCRYTNTTKVAKMEPVNTIITIQAKIY